MKCVIISGGHIEDNFALEWLQQNGYDVLIAADSGMDFLYRNDLKPDVIAGDFDSVSQTSYDFFQSQDGVEIMKLNPIKNDTDTEFVIREAIRRGATEITVLGGTGTRLDHVMGNVHLLGIGLQEKVQMELVDTHNRIRMINSSLTLTREGQFGQFVSVLPFAGSSKGVTLEGFKYPLKDYTLESYSSLGISNEIIEEKATVHVQEGVLLVVEARD